MKRVAVVQARMGSSRLPGKVLKDILGRPMLYHVVRRARAADLVDLVVVATTEAEADDVLEAFCVSEGIPCFRGSENDVLDRYYRTARFFGADVIVRITADCPLLDPAVIDRVIDVFRSGEYDYVSNALEPTYPDGLDTEVFSIGALQRAWEEAGLVSEREHVTPYIWKNKSIFRTAAVRHTEDLSGFRWTVDEPGDLEFVRRIYAYFGAADFGMTDVLELLQREQGLSEINRGPRRNEGYEKSLRADVFNFGGKE